MRQGDFCPWHPVISNVGYLLVWMSSANKHAVGQFETISKLACPCCLMIAWPNSSGNCIPTTQKGDYTDSEATISRVQTLKFSSGNSDSETHWLFALVTLYFLFGLQRRAIAEALRSCECAWLFRLWMATLRRLITGGIYYKFRLKYGEKNNNNRI